MKGKGSLKRGEAGRKGKQEQWFEGSPEEVSRIELSDGRDEHYSFR